MLRNIVNFKQFMISFLFLTIFFIVSMIVYLISFYDGTKGIAIQFTGGGNDGFFYYNEVLRILSGDTTNLTSIYPLILSIFPYVFGENEYMVLYFRIFNIFGLYLLYKIIIKSIFSNYGLNQKSRYEIHLITLIFCLSYISLINNTIISLYRDSWIAFLFIVCIYVYNHAYSKLFTKLLLLITAIFCLFLFREYAALSFIVGMCVFTFTENKLFHKNKLLVAILVFSCLGIYYTLLLDLKIPIIQMSLKDALVYRMYYMDGLKSNSQMGISLTEGSYITFLKNYLVSYFYNLFSPLPWQIKNVQYVIILFIETIPMMLGCYYVFKNKKLLTKNLRFIVTQALIWMGFISITNDNIGSAIRLRSIAFILIFIVIISILLRKRETYINEEK